MKKNREEASASSSLEGPVEVSYTLTSDDVYNALKTSKIYRKNFIKAGHFVWHLVDCLG
jgi:hypothetical protein